VVSQLGHLPSADERVTLDGVELIVERVAGHAIETVIARRMEQEAP
jgi:hypothetical protein